MMENKGRGRHWALTILFWMVALYLGTMIVNSRIDIGRREQELASLSAKVVQQQAQREELERTLAGSDESIVEQVARDELGYAMPNQRVFVDVTGK